MPSTSLAASLIVVLALEPTATPVETPAVAPSFLVPDMPDPSDPAWTAPNPPPPPPPPAPEPSRASGVTRSPAPASAPGATRSPSASATTTPSASPSPPPVPPSPPLPSHRVDRRKLATAGVVTTGIGLGLGVVAYQADRRVDELSGAIRAQEALGTPQSEIEGNRLERDRERQRITLVTAAVGAGVLGVTGLTLLAIALLRRGSPSLTHRSPRLRLAPAFVLAF